MIPYALGVSSLWRLLIQRFGVFVFVGEVGVSELAWLQVAVEREAATFPFPCSLSPVPFPFPAGVFPCVRPEVPCGMSAPLQMCWSRGIPAYTRGIPMSVGDAASLLVKCGLHRVSRESLESLRNLLQLALLLVVAGFHVHSHRN